MLFAQKMPCSITALEVSSPLHTPILRSPSFRGGSGPVRPLQPSAARKKPPVSTQDLTHKPAIQDLKLFSPRRFTSITSRWQLCTIEFFRWPALRWNPQCAMQYVPYVWKDVPPEREYARPRQPCQLSPTTITTTAPHRIALKPQRSECHTIGMRDWRVY
jgi:hypothetical protein